MTKHGVSANHAAWFANNQLKMDFEAYRLGAPFSRFIAMIRNAKLTNEKTLIVRDDGTSDSVAGADLPPQEVLFKRLAEGAPLSAAMEPSHGIATNIDLDEIVSEVQTRFAKGAG